MGLSTAGGNYFYGSGRNQGITGPLPGSGNGMNKPQPVQGTIPVQPVRAYSGFAPKGPSQAAIADFKLGNASPPRGEYHARQPFWRGNQYVPPKDRGRMPGWPDPPSDGPQRPSLHQEFASWSMWQGTDATHYADDLSREYNKVAGNSNMPVMPVGQQDGTWTAINGGQVGYYRVYHRAGNDAGAGNDPVSTDQVGRQQAGPSYVFSGPPHGLHTQTVPDGKQPLATRLASPQMRSVRQDRISNSNYSGQSYSTQTLHQGQASGATKMRKSRNGVSR
jgi:hypothetical protein